MPNRIAKYLAIICFSIQAVVPAGFMPANGHDGWFVKWCPEGVSMQVMHALFGHKHHHHHGGSTPEYNQCDLAGLALAEDAHEQATLSVDLSDVEPAQPVSAELYLFRPFAGYWSHAPPQSIEPEKLALV